MTGKRQVLARLYENLARNIETAVMDVKNWLVDQWGNLKDVVAPWVWWLWFGIGLWLLLMVLATNAAH